MPEIPSNRTEQHRGIRQKESKEHRHRSKLTTADVFFRQAITTHCNISIESPSPASQMEAHPRAQLGL